jgi:hypothetical protein
MKRTFPLIGFERYWTDIVVHRGIKDQAGYVKAAIGRKPE